MFEVEPYKSRKRDFNVRGLDVPSSASGVNRPHVAAFRRTPLSAEYNIFDGLTIRNAEVAFWAGVKDVAGAKGLTVRNCRIENVGIGINAQYAGSRDFYIADNVFLGREDRHRILGWANPGLYGAHPINSYYAIKVYGSGHVIAHNAVAFFHDGISVCTHGVPEPERDQWAVAIDIYNNELTNFHDNAVEIDGSMHNVRVMRNRMLNSASHPFCNQPAIGGPIYWIRNIIYHAPGGSTRTSNGAPGMIYLNNTILSETSIRMVLPTCSGSMRSWFSPRPAGNS